MVVFLPPKFIPKCVYINLNKIIVKISDADDKKHSVANFSCFHLFLSKK